MDSRVKIYKERANNESRLSSALFNLSEKEDTKVDLGAEKDDTFYSAAISHAYYSIFYCAKALLLTEGIDTKSPEVHKKTLEEFEVKFVKSGKLDVALLNIYKKMIIRADELLGIFKGEKSKRGDYTYSIIPQANREPAQESINNAKKFLKHTMAYLEKQK